MNYYKLSKHPLQTNLPFGYCTADIPEAYDGLYYISISGFYAPLWKTSIQKMIPYPFDDIVGLRTDMRKPKYTNMEVLQYLKSIGVIWSHSKNDWEEYVSSTNDEYAEDGISFTEMIRSWIPGWQWTSKITTGQIGECIINIPANPILVDNNDLLKVIQKCNEYNLMDSNKLISQILKFKKEGVPYKINEQELLASIL